MRGEMVALDLETTGLSAESDAIIEIGAVRIVDGQITDEYATLVNPGREHPISPYVTQLTQITTEMVLSAPGIATVIPAVRAFVGNAPIIGHNIGFDLGFLYRQGILQSNLRVDTYELASVLLPRASRYNLSALADHFGLKLENAHRALDDARASALLYWHLWQKLLTLPEAALAEISAAAQGFDWDAKPAFDAAMQERRITASFTPPSDAMLIELFGSAPAVLPSPAPVASSYPPPTADVVASLLQNDSPLAAAFPDYTERPQQREMARAVADAFTSAQHILIEAGAGTGKSLAYLLPVALWSAASGERVIISTNTITLQDQLLEKDIPHLTSALGLALRTAVLKGRGNYLCPRRLAAVRRRQPTQVDELRTLAKILVWLLESTTGDKSEISLRGPAENNVWQRLSAEDEGCALDRCSSVMAGACPFYKARQAAEAAHLLVINHALLLSDPLSENRVLPDYNRLIVDEAHHLEEAATNSLSFRLDEATLYRRLSDLGGVKRGLLGDLLNSLRDHIPERQAARFEAFIRDIQTAAAAMSRHIKALFNAYALFLEDAASGGRSGDYSIQLRLNPTLRARASFAECQTIWNTLREFFEVLSDALRRLGTGLQRLENSSIPGLQDFISSSHAAARYFDDVQTQLTAFNTNPSDNAVYWLNLSQNNGSLSVHAAPLHIGTLIDTAIWKSKATVVLTSATLQTNRSFDHLSSRLRAEHAHTLDVGSPFDYRRAALVYIPKDIPEPTEHTAYQQALERGIIELAAALDGRMLVLFTSYTSLRQTAQAIGPRLALGGITVYDQSESSRRQALDGFKSTEKAVLMGTRSFWEGVDLPGDVLNAVVITRLPFAVPTDPIFSARSDSYKDGFKEYALPDAILRFRQGFGRLIRTATDRGIVTIFDRRITSKSYGADFLNALPDCTIEYGTLRGLPDAARRWLANGSSASNPDVVE